MSVRNYPEGPRIYLDCDGVVADFERAMDEYNLPASKLKLIRSVYENLYPMPGAINGVNALLDLGYFVMMLTKIPSKNPHAATEKLIWVNKYLPRIEDNVIIAPDKGCVGTEQDFLVDDHPEWANAHNFAGTIIKFGGEIAQGHAHVSSWEELVIIFTQHRDYFFSTWACCA